MPEKPMYLPDDTAASEAAHHYYGANIKRMRREIGQNREFLAAQAAHAAMVASHCACKKRPRALFDNSGEFKNGAHYAMRQPLFSLGEYGSFSGRPDGQHSHVCIFALLDEQLLTHLQINVWLIPAHAVCDGYAKHGPYRVSCSFLLGHLASSVELYNTIHENDA
jgi:hypothetical protein